MGAFLWSRSPAILAATFPTPLHPERINPRVQSLSAALACLTRWSTSSADPLHPSFLNVSYFRTAPPGTGLKTEYPALPPLQFSVNVPGRRCGTCVQHGCEARTALSSLFSLVSWAALLISTFLLPPKGFPSVCSAGSAGGTCRKPYAILSAYVSLVTGTGSLPRACAGLPAEVAPG